jgi:murein L,D-transpeptidase YcbB/YkuD
MKQPSLLPVYKYTTWALLVLVLASCHKDLTQVQQSPRTTLPVVTDTTALPSPVLLAGKSVLIDSFKHPLDKRKLLLPVKDAYQNKKVQQKIQGFYAANGYKTKWLDDVGPNALYTALAEQLSHADRYGLSPEEYDIRELDHLLEAVYRVQPPAADLIVELDMQITEAFFLFTTHLTEGKLTRAAGSNIWIRSNSNNAIARKTPDLDVQMLAGIATPGQLAEMIRRVQPASEQYSRLQRALEEYRALEKTNTTAFPVIPVTEKIKPDERHAAIPVLRRKLSLTDLKIYTLPVDTTTGMVDSLLYDAELVSAVKWFQLRHGLTPDGIVGERTLRFLNQPLKDKADILALNLERMRWIPERNENSCIRVNVPEYMLRIYENQKPEFEMKVIVGAPNKATPIFDDVLKNIVFSPTWTVPTSIIREEIIPHLKKDPQYYAEKNYTFYRGDVAIDPSTEVWEGENANPYQIRVVQQPGADNSLGRVKFLLTNDMSIYLHDTPNHRLFNKDYRALSHGCVRLDEPARFAAYLLRNQPGWSMASVQKAMDGNAPAGIPLKKQYPVHLEYFTAWVDDNGLINFREDIYGFDKQQLRELYTVGGSSVAGL